MKGSTANVRHALDNLASKATGKRKDKANPQHDDGVEIKVRVEKTERGGRAPTRPPDRDSSDNRDAVAGRKQRSSTSQVKAPTVVRVSKLREDFANELAKPALWFDREVFTEPPTYPQVGTGASDGQLWHRVIVKTVASLLLIAVAGLVLNSLSAATALLCGYLIAIIGQL